MHFSTSVVQAEGKDSGAASTAFRTKCATEQMALAEVGKNVPDLRSETVRKVSDSGLAQIIANGRNGMPSFKSSLHEAQIHEIVAYIRTLAAKK